MKKVGIATMFGGANYGNALQNYAVEQLISQCGYDPVTLQNLTKWGFSDNSWREIPTLKKLSPSYIKRYLRTRLNNKYGCKNDLDFRRGSISKYKKTNEEYCKTVKSRFEKFESFRLEYLHVDPTVINAKWYDKANIDTYFAFVCGSDQVWNPNYPTTSSVDFLQFAPEHKRIALSPSFGVSSIPDDRKKDYAEWLSHIPHLSVREDAGAEIIKELTGIDAEVLLDPTLCLTADQWSKIAKEPKSKPEGDYIFCYFLGNKNKKYCKYIDQYAKANNCKIVDIFDINDLRYYDCDPCEFVWLLSNAKAVFTDSFHGTAFSVNLQKPFVVFERDEGGSSMSSRIATLLKKIGLEDRRFQTLDIDSVPDIDFSNASSIISAEREKEIAYLRNALLGVEKSGSVYLTNNYHCTGCGACYNACPTGAVLMVADSEGFKYPKIDPQKCINCHACEKACPADVIRADDELPPAYAAYSKDGMVQKSSSSGGVFTHIAKYILSLDGVVFGAAYDEDFKVGHIAIEKPEELYKLRTSKYVQSDSKTAYSQAKEYLKQGRKVLFTGTPCQIAALRQYLRKDYDNLYTQDIICHGVPSPETFEKYLKDCHSGKKIRSISFRDKTVGWNDFSMKIEYSDDTSYRELAVKDPFVKAFLANLNLRPSCYQCQYKTAGRVSDITLADYWGVELVHPELKEQQGVSLVLTHSEKGECLLKAIEKDINIITTSAERAIGMNSATRQSVACPPKRKDYFAEYKEAPTDKLVERLTKPTITQKIKKFIRVNGSRVKKVLRKLKIIKG